MDAPHQGVRPFTIACCDWYWSRLTWTDWNGVEANGSGTYLAYCIGEPGCPEENGLYFDYPVLVHLYGVKNCSGKRTFTHIQTTFTGELPYWGSERVIRESLYCPQPPKAGGSGGNRRDTRIISYWDGGSDAGTPHYVRHPRKVGFNIGDGGYWLVRHADWRHWGDQRTNEHGRLSWAALEGTPDRSPRMEARSTTLLPASR